VEPRTGENRVVVERRVEREARAFESWVLSSLKPILDLSQ
jgi:hypothetical protein